MGRPTVNDISTPDVLAIINAKKRVAPQRAAALLALIKRFFSWVVDAPARGELDEQGQRIDYGLATSPCDRLTKKKIIGETTPRQRRLTDAELFAFWRATARLVIRSVHSIASSPSPPCGSTRPRSYHGRKSTAITSSSRQSA
jgi:hypothetical protein